MMMDAFSVFVILLLSVVTVAFGLRIPLQETYESEHSYIDLSEAFDSSNVRHKRSPHYLPDRANITLKIKGEDVRLCLQRNPNINVNIPVYMNKDGEIQKIEVEDIQGACLYQDLNTGASLLLERSQGELETHTKVFGSFFFGSHHYAIQPSDDDSDHVTERTYHVVSRIPEKSLVFEHSIPQAMDLTDMKQERKPIPHSRHRRQSNSYIIEVLAVTDYKIYEFWYGQTSGSNRQAQAISLLRRYYAYTFNGMDLRYKSISGMDFVIDIWSAGVEIATTRSASPWSEQIAVNGAVDGDTILDTLKTWVQDQTNLPPNDHVMGFTGYNLGTVLAGNVIRDSAGIAFRGTLCTPSSISVVEDGLDFISITTAAHELGHSLSALHDGESNGCSTDDNFIMAEVNRVDTTQLGKNLWIFSSCSLAAFKNYIENLQNNNCMLAESGNSIQVTVDVPMAQVYQPDDLCVYQQGEGSYVCRSVQDYSSICVAMFCNDPGTRQCYSILPAEATPCGKGKWCDMGVCKSSSDAPDVPDNCPIGNRPGIVRDGKTCTELVSEDNRMCFVVEKDCCDSCNAVRTDLPGCEYGDANTTTCSTFNRVDCYFNENFCCGTCATLKNSAFVGCEYGDKIGGCMKNDCQFYTSTDRARCCETCFDGQFPTTPKPTTPTPTTPSPGTGVTTRTPVQTTTAVPTEEEESNIVLIGIGIGAGVLVVLIVLILVCIVKRRSGKKDYVDSHKPRPNSYANSGFTNTEGVVSAPAHPPPRRTYSNAPPPAAAIIRPTRMPSLGRSLSQESNGSAHVISAKPRPVQPSGQHQPIAIPLRVPAHHPPRRFDQPGSNAKPTVPLKPPPPNQSGQPRVFTTQNGTAECADGYMMPSSVQSSPCGSIQYTEPNISTQDTRARSRDSSSSMETAQKRNTKTIHYRKPHDITRNTVNPDLSVKNQMVRKQSDTYDSIGDIQNMLSRSNIERTSNDNNFRLLERRPTLPANRPTKRLSEDTHLSGTLNSSVATEPETMHLDTHAPIVPRKQYDDEMHYADSDQSNRPKQTPMPMEPPKPRPRDPNRKLSMEQPNHACSYQTSIKRPRSDKQDHNDNKNINLVLNDRHHMDDFNDLQSTYDQADSCVNSLNSLPKQASRSSKECLPLRENIREINSLEPLQYSSIDEVEIRI